MNLSVNRKLAGVVAVLLIVGSILFSGGRSLGKLREETSEMFYMGVNSDSLSIYNDLQARLESSYNILTVGRKYLGQYAGAVLALSEARDALSAAQDPAAMYSANAALSEAVESLLSSLEGGSMTGVFSALQSSLQEHGLSENDARSVMKQYNDFSSRNDTISHDGYNQHAAEFNQKLGRFPASLIGAVTGVKELPLFR